MFLLTGEDSSLLDGAHVNRGDKFLQLVLGLLPSSLLGPWVQKMSEFPIDRYSLPSPNRVPGGLGWCMF